MSIMNNFNDKASRFYAWVKVSVKVIHKGIRSLPSPSSYEKKNMNGTVYFSIMLAVITCHSVLFAYRVNLHIPNYRAMKTNTPNTLNLTEIRNETLVLSSKNSSNGTKEANATIREGSEEALLVGLPTNVTSTPEKSRFSYAFLVAGCDPKKPSYKGYLYNIVVAKHVLSHHNSTADVVVMIRMHTEANQSTLPPEHEAILTKSGVKVKYIPKPIIDNFHTAMMDKFRILQMTEYDRVLYLDADVMPVHNLDFMFEKSMGPNPQLEKNVIIAYNREPASGGFFMLTPNEDEYDEITKIIMKRESEGYDFNETIGFGHIITPPDNWESLFENGTKWDFYGAFTDQGLLYHWTKYVKKQVSIIIGKHVKSYQADDVDDKVKLVRTELSNEVFKDVKMPFNKYIVNLNNWGLGVVPYKGFVHFVESKKPWLDRYAKNPPEDIENIEQARSAKQLWYHLLRKVNKENQLNIDVENLSVGRPSLGMFPANAMVMWAKEAREKMKK